MQFLQQIAKEEKENQNGVPAITLLTRDKSDGNKANFQKLVKAITTSKNVRITYKLNYKIARNNNLFWAFSIGFSITI